MKAELVSPGILGLAAAASPFALAYRTWFFYTYLDPRPELDFLAIPVAYFLVGLGLVITYSGARSLIGTEHRASGGVVFAGSLLTGLIAVTSLFRNFLTPTDELIFAGLGLSSSLGILGGLKGIYWERSWKDGAAVPKLADYSRWALIGGLDLILCVAVVSGYYEDQLTILTSLIVPVSAALVYKTKGNQKLLGLAIIAGALWTGSPFWFFTNLGIGGSTVDFLGLAGTALSVIAGVKIWKSEVSKLNAPSNDAGPVMKPE